MANMKFFVAGVQECFLDLPVSDNLTEHEYFVIADENKDEEMEYISIFVQFGAGRDNLVILQA